jgi:hypothetical protein
MVNLGYLTLHRNDWGASRGKKAKGKGGRRKKEERSRGKKRRGVEGKEE